MRASRLLSIQMLLQTRGRMSARELAQELEVSVRTLHRDIDQLAAAGVPVVADRGREGGFKLLDGWKTSLTGLTAAESQAVFLSGLAVPAAQLGLKDDVESARLKLLAALPAGARDDAQRVSSRLHLDPIDWYHDAEPVPHLATIAEAVWREQQLALCYESWKTTAARIVEPLGLVLKAGIWYLVAMLKNEPRTFRISNIIAADMLPERVRRPHKFDLAAYWRASTERFERELYRSEATLLATPAGLKNLSYVSSAVARAVAASTRAQGEDGRSEVRVPIESIEQATGQLLRLAPEVEVVAPAQLRTSIIERIGAIAKLYGLTSC